MDQPLVARRVRDMLAPGGAWIHVGATTHRGAAGAAPVHRPAPSVRSRFAPPPAGSGPERPLRRAGQGDRGRDLASLTRSTATTRTGGTPLSCPRARPATRAVPGPRRRRSFDR
jgi:hypothetical protein